MKVRPFLILTIIMLAFGQQGCTQENSKTPLVSGTIKPDAEWNTQLYLVRPDYYKNLISSYEGTVVDSATIGADGSFVFHYKGWLKEKGLYLLFAQPRGRPYANEIASPVIRENYICLVLEPGSSIRLSGDIRQLSRSYRLQAANSESRMLAALQSAREPLYKEYESLQASNAGEDPESWATHGNEATQKAIATAIDAFLDTSQAVLPAFAALRWRVPDNEFRDNPELYLKVKNRLRQLAPRHTWHKELDYYMDPARMPVLVGEQMPDFALANPQGDTLQLKDVLSPLVLVDFWASWCAPCRRENKEFIRPLYDRYHAKGFNVLGVSIDADKDSWTNAIQRDGAVWYQVSDLLGDSSPVRSELKFEYIPANYLLDQSGRLLARNLHGEELRAFVEAYFNNK